MNIKQIGEAITDLRTKIDSLLTGGSKVNAEQMEAAQSDWANKFEAIESDLSALTAENTDLKTKVEELEAAAADAKATHEAELKAKEDEVEARAGKKAASTAAAQGIPPVPVKVDPTAPLAGQKTIVEQYLELTGAEKVSFFKKHKAALIKAARV